ncbi:Armadillo repeat only 1 [Hirschfeldia incana]|nr:Armadillo repeat only 1 [Hirschfeldia incana]
MADIVKQILVRPIQLADQITKAAEEAYSFRQECLEVKAKTEKLAGLLRQAARASNDLYERPTRRIIDDTEQVLFKAIALVEKCRAAGLMKRLFTIIPAAAFRKITMQLENSLGDVSWLLRVSASGDDRDDEYLGLPPIAANEPILCLIWEQVANLFTGSLDERSDSAASLVSLARDNDRYGRLIIEEGGVPPLLKLVKEGKLEGQENAARAIGLLGRDPESVEQIVNAGVCQVFAKILKEGHMKVQTVVAWAVSELASNHPKCQDHFAQNNIIRFLVSHLAFETVQEHSKYAIVSNKQTLSSIHTVVMASNTNPGDNKKTSNEQEEAQSSNISHPMSNQTPSQMHNIITNTLAMKGSDPGSGPASASGSGTNKNQTKQSSQHHTKGGPTPRGNNNPTHVSLMGTSIKGREYEDPATKAQMKAMAARALWQLSRGNLQICRSITESRALLCFAVLLEKGDDEVKSYSALAMMEITDVAEQYSELRRSAFKPTSPAAKAVVEQLLKVIENEIPELLIPCIKSIGSLSRTFRATETRIIAPLVKLLDEREAEVSMEAAVALIKFSCTENFLRDNHSKAIIAAGGAKHLIQLVYFGEQMVQVPALVLLCYIALSVPDSETLAQEEVLVVLEWSTKQSHLVEAPMIDEILPEAKSRLELYQSRGSRGFH